jgi:hypothetical protein
MMHRFDLNRVEDFLWLSICFALTLSIAGCFGYTLPGKTTPKVVVDRSEYLGVNKEVIIEKIGGPDIAIKAEDRSYYYYEDASKTWTVGTLLFLPMPVWSKNSSVLRYQHLNI